MRTVVCTAFEMAWHTCTSYMEHMLYYNCNYMGLWRGPSYPSEPITRHQSDEVVGMPACAPFTFADVWPHPLTCLKRSNRDHQRDGTDGFHRWAGRRSSSFTAVLQKPRWRSMRSLSSHQHEFGPQQLNCAMFASA